MCGFVVVGGFSLRLLLFCCQLYCNNNNNKLPHSTGSIIMSSEGNKINFNGFNQSISVSNSRSER